MRRGEFKTDLSGNVFGRLTVISRAPKPDGQRYWHWLCVCSCGNETVSTAGQLRSGRKVSCGCYKKEVTSKRMRTHGLRNLPEYATWKSMHSRCFNPNVKCYPRYGGRGIKMSDQWRVSFTQFLADMGSKPTPKHSIDRIDVNGDYCAENCRWVTPPGQSKNKRWHAAEAEVQRLKTENDRLMEIICALQQAA